MTRRTVKLHLAQPEDAPKGPSLALVKKALKLYRGRGIDRATRHRNARKWLAAMDRLGDKHTLRGGEVRWGRPGIPFVGQLTAPRRLGGK